MTIQRRKAARMILNNGIDWYAVIMLNGAAELHHQTGLSAILQCNHDPARYDMLCLIQCGFADTMTAALEIIDNEVLTHA